MSPSLICTILRLLTHIGFVIDLDSGSFEVPLERWEILQQLITVALSRQKVLVHLLSRIAGHLSSMILAIGPIVLIKSRQCHSYLQQYSLHSTLPSLTARETNSPINPTCLVRIFAKKVGLPPLPLTFPYGVMLEQQVGVPRWRIKIAGTRFFPPRVVAWHIQQHTVRNVGISSHSWILFGHH